VGNIPGPVHVVSQSAEANSLGHQLCAATRKRRVTLCLQVAVICRANISTKPDPFMPIVFRSLVAFSIVTSLPDSSIAPRVVMVSL